MDRQAYIDEIKFRLTGNLLETELDTKAFDTIVNVSLREIQRYISSTKIITIPFSKCIDLSKVKDEDGKDIKINSVSRIYRADGYVGESSTTAGMVDPMYVSQWQLLGGTSNMRNFQDYMYNYEAWNTLLQMRNTTSTDLAFRYDKSSNKLYINVASNMPGNITIEYVPRYDDVSEIVSDYWIDMLVRLCVANAKVIVGRIRSRYSQSNALWAQDGDTILNEGNAELAEIREHLVTNTQLVYGID